MAARVAYAKIINSDDVVVPECAALYPYKGPSSYGEGSVSPGALGLPGPTLQDTQDTQDAGVAPLLWGAPAR
jgi:hypothetical protein